MITDIEGNFALDAKQGDIIVISYIGMKSAEVKVPANGQNKSDAEGGFSVDG